MTAHLGVHAFTDMRKGLDGVDVGAEAVLVGRQGAETIAAEEIGRSIGSLYRVLATIPRAVPRAWI